MKSPTTVESNGVLTIRDNHANPLLPVALATVGIVIVWRNVSSPGAPLIGIGLTVVALMGLVRSTVNIDRKNGTVTVRRKLLRMGISARYDLHCVKGVDTRWSKFGDESVMRIAESGNVRLVRIAGPTRADLGPIAQDVHRYLAGV